MKYINVKPGAAPGIEVKGGMAYCEVSGELFPITSFLAHNELGLVPVLDIPQMSDERLRGLAREHPVREVTA